MSGRKASEVNQLLRNGKDIRAGSINLLNNELGNHTEARKKLNDSIKKAASVRNSGPDLTTAEKEFRDAAETIKKDLESINNELAAIEKKIPSEDLRGRYDSIMKKYSDNDRAADKVSSDLNRKIQGQSRSDPWYCDEEYRRADTVAQEYRRLKNEVSALQKKLSADTNSCRVLTSQVNDLCNRAKELTKKANDLETKAKDAAELRANAGKARQTISKDLKAIDSAIAEKFLKDKYDKLKAEVNSFSGSSDTEVVNGLNKMVARINNFSSELHTLYIAYLLRKNSIKERIDNISEKLGAKVFSDPMNDFSNTKRSMVLTDFLDEFCQSMYTAEIAALMKNAEADHEAERFDKAESTISELTQLLDKATELAANTHEKRVKTIDNALAIRDAMRELNYDVYDEAIINEDGSFGGINIICEAGDEKITFENTNVDDDGKLTFGIFHKESTTGTCASSWHEIRQKLSGEGIFIQDITKNGRSIHSPNSAAAKTEVNTPTTMKSN